MSLANNPTFRVAFWFVTNYLGREWTTPDFHGVHMKQAGILLKNYSENDVMGCLSAIKDGIIGEDAKIKFLAGLALTEPPLMSQWFEYRDNPPPTYLEGQYSEWEKRTQWQQSQQGV